MLLTNALLRVSLAVVAIIFPEESFLSLFRHSPEKIMAEGEISSVKDVVCG